MRFVAQHPHQHGDHGHDGHGHHHHEIDRDADRRLLWAALIINLGFAVVEVAAGLIAGSVALLSDAAHMVTDAGAIAIALVAARLASRPPGVAIRSGSVEARSSAPSSTAPRCWCSRA